MNEYQSISQTYLQNSPALPVAQIPPAVDHVEPAAGEILHHNQVPFGVLAGIVAHRKW